jgi:outer membrane protein, heavy metal efflux system
VSRHGWFFLAVFLIHGCCHAQPDQAELLLNPLANQVRDPEPPTCPGTVTPLPATPRAETGAKSSPTMPMDQTPPSPKNQLAIPADVPGSNLPLFVLPSAQPDRDRALQRLVHDLPPLPPFPGPAPGPSGQPMTLSELQGLAANHHPSIENALAGVEAARGEMVQAGAYPNPTVAWEADQVNTFGAGYQGAYVEQPIKGANKLKLKTAIAAMDLRNAEIALEKAQYEVATQVRSSYFAVLVALENVKVSRAMANFTELIYRNQVKLLANGLAADYEPVQLRPLVFQTRLNLIAAMNHYHAAWKQLAAAVATPDLPPTELSGRVDWPVPVFHHDEVLARLLERNTDMQSALVSIRRARYSLDLAEVTAFPDFDVRVLIQKDNTTPPFNTVYSATLGVPLPIWDQNRGGIMAAKNQLQQANQGPPQVQLRLTASLADAYYRYETARQQVQLGMVQVQDQVRAYRALYSRWNVEGARVSFGDLVSAEQTMVGYVSAYITALGLQWQAVVDVANLLQTNDLFQVCPMQEVAPVPDLESLFHHGADTMPGNAPAGADLQHLSAPPDRPAGPAAGSPPATVRATEESPGK